MVQIIEGIAAGTGSRVETSWKGWVKAREEEVRGDMGDI
jgi:hypothetical protein